MPAGRRKKKSADRKADGTTQYPLRDHAERHGSNLSNRWCQLDDNATPGSRRCRGCAGFDCACASAEPETAQLVREHWRQEHDWPLVGMPDGVVIKNPRCTRYNCRQNNRP
ncbi:hypothetical protein ABIB38_001707 [Massilia sp. UYP11]